MSAVLVAAALGTAPPASSSPALAYEANHLQKATQGLDMAIHLLLCAEARAALERPELHREVLRWLVSNAHTCPDTRLFLDAFGI